MSVKFEEFADYSFMNEWELPPVGQTGYFDGRRHALDLRHKDCRTFDLSGYDPEDFEFDSQTMFPVADKLPAGFDPAKVLEMHKNPGLHVRRLHATGLRGQGMSIAIIDQPLSDHAEYHDNVVHYEQIGRWGNLDGTMHGAAVASIAVGKNVGVAPDAKLYFFAAVNVADWGAFRAAKTHGEQCAAKTAEFYADALDRILEINGGLSDKNKIRVVSASWGEQGDPRVRGSDKWRAALGRAKAAGLFVCTCALDEEYGLSANGLGRAWDKDPDDLENYGPRYWDDNAPADVWKKTLGFPMDHRTTAAPTGFADYVHYAQGGFSWMTPWAAAMFLLARQNNPNITPEQFWKVGLKTGSFNPRAKCVVANPEKIINEEIKNEVVRNKIISELYRRSDKW